MGTAQHKLTQDVAVGWNSSYYMITRLLAMACDQWSLLEELQQALEPFGQATSLLSGEAYVTVSVLPPLVKALQKSTKTVFESAPVATFQTAAAAEIASRLVCLSSSLNFL